MTKGEVDTAERKALNVFDKWNDVTGFAQPNTSYYYEIQSVIEDAVHIGIQMALFGNIFYNKDGEIIKNKSTQL